MSGIVNSTSGSELWASSPPGTPSPSRRRERQRSLSNVANEVKTPRTPSSRRPPISPRRPPPVSVPRTPRRNQDQLSASEKSPVKPALLGATAGFLLTGPIGFVAGAFAGAASVLTPTDAFRCSGGGGVQDWGEEDDEESRPAALIRPLGCRAPSMSSMKQSVHCRAPSNIPSLQVRESEQLLLSTRFLRL